MAKNKQPTAPSKEKPFSTSAFSALKGIAIAKEAPAAAPTVAIKPAAPREDDSELFLQAMTGIRPLNDATQKKPASSVTTTAPLEQRVHRNTEPDASPLFLDEIKRLKLEVTFTEQPPNEDELQALSGNRLRQLKRGVVSVESQLDLHGLTREEALLELPRFLLSAQRRHEKAALIITGKGLNSAGQPVLQQAVAGWLRDAGRQLVSEYAPAPPAMGGSGAFVVFLKTIKQEKT